MKPENRCRCDRQGPAVLRRALAACVLAVALGVSAAASALSESPQGCCRNDAEIARWHKNADRLYAQFRAREAINELRKILSVDQSNFEALVKIARAHIDVGDNIPENGADWKDRKLKEYKTAEDYSRRAIQVDPNSTWGHFWLAAALGNGAILSPVPRQLEIANEIRGRIEKAIALDPQNGFAYHAYGVWHRKVAEIGGASRVLAPVLYGQAVPSGSLDKSVEYLSKAVELNPQLIVSRLELARSHVARGEWEPARTLLRSIPELPVQFSDDARHKRQAAQMLAEIQDR